MKYLPLALMFFLIGSNRSYGQDSLWTLKDCVDYAKSNNLTIQQNVLNERVAKMQWEQSKWSQLPDFSMNSSLGRSFGRSIDPTSNNFINTTYDYMGMNGSSNVLIFGWFQKRNTIVKNDLLHRAVEADLSQMQNDIVLNIVNGYLRILLAKEQLKIGIRQLEISKEQVIRTEKLLLSGRSNGQDLAQVKTQLSNDSAGYFKALLSLQQSTIDMKALLNFEFKDSFDVADLKARNRDEKIHTDNPEAIYNEAEFKFGRIRSADLKIRSAQKELAISKGNLYPSLSLGVSAGTNYSSNFTEQLPNGETKTMTWGKQFQNNFSQSISLGLSIPIFNGFIAKYAVKNAKLALQTTTLQSKEARLRLKQDIYKAFNEMQTAYYTCNATKASVAFASTALEFAQKRYDKGLINANDLLLAQNVSFKATVEAVSAEYDFVFKQMVIDYYLGNDVFAGP